MPGAASAAHLLPSPRAPQPNNPAALLQQRTRCSLAVFFFSCGHPALELGITEGNGSLAGQYFGAAFHTAPRRPFRAPLSL